MVTAARTRLGLGLALVTLLSAAGCTAHDTNPSAPTGAYRLVAFDSCADALAGLRAATSAVVGPYGLPGYGGVGGGAVIVPPAAQRGPAAATDSGAAAEKDAVGQDPAYSGTNVQEQGVDEPDIVKTDGRRIVTLSNGRLSVVDVASRRLVGVVDLSADAIGYDADLLLAGDHALVLGNSYGYAGAPVQFDTPVPDVARPTDAVVGAQLVLVDLTAPRVLSRATADGSIVDARQVGSTVRIVTRSAPRLALPNATGTAQERLTANRAAIDAADINAWLPRLQVTTDDRTVLNRVGCDAVTRPASSSYSGTNLLTVLTVDASRDGIDDGHPVSIVADGDTVYSSGTSLYIASNEAWPIMVPQLAAAEPRSGEGRAASSGGAQSGTVDGVGPQAEQGPNTPAARPGTEIYRFDTTTTPPRFVGGGSVPGRLINQYAMSEWDGYLRVAATTDSLVKPESDTATPTQSGVYVLHTEGGQLRQVGAVEGLGTGEQIYAVRFVGTAGYVVTFRQTDPLYTVDLHDPAAPVVRGELKLNGYSAYLHPIGPTRLIGVGQDATAGGRTTGTQVSLFDVTDLADPARLANYTLPGAYSDAEFDPHAFLYWPQGGGGLVVVPVRNPYGVAVPDSAAGSGSTDGGGSAPAQPARLAGSVPARASGALVLRIDGDEISEVGFISQPEFIDNYYDTAVTRSLITTDGGGHTTLWTVSAGGIMANDADTLARLAWLPL